MGEAKMLARSVELQKLLLLSYYATSVYGGPFILFTQTSIYSVRQDYFEITCAIHLNFSFFKSFLSSKQPQSFLPGADAEVHSAEFGP